MLLTLLKMVVLVAEGVVLLLEQHSEALEHQDKVMLGVTEMLILLIMVRVAVVKGRQAARQLRLRLALEVWDKLVL
jgi:hypothetical protein